MIFLCALLLVLLRLRFLLLPPLPLLLLLLLLLLSSASFAFPIIGTAVISVHMACYRLPISRTVADETRPHVDNSVSMLAQVDLASNVGLTRIAVHRSD